jgi:MFS family permease
MLTPNVNRQLFYLFLCNLAIVFIGMGLFPVLPLYIAQFGASPSVAGLYMASTYAAISGGTLASGWLAGRIGRKRTFIATGALSLPAVLLMGQATTIWQLVLLTAVVWFAGGIGLTLTSVFTGLAASSHNRGKSFSLLHLSTPLGALIGGMAVSQLLAWKGYPLLFLFLGVVWSIWPLVGLLVYDQPSSARAATAQKEMNKTTAPLKLSFYLLLMVTVLSAVAINISRLGTSLSMQALSFSAGAVASTAAVSGLAAIPVTYFIGILSDRLGRRRFLMISYLLAAGGALTLSIASQLWHFWLAAALILIARSVSNSVASAFATDILAPEDLARGLAWLNSAGWITGVAAFAGAGHIIQTMGAPMLYGLAIVLALVAALELRQIKYRPVKEATIEALA